MEARRFQWETLRRLRDAGARIVVGQDGVEGSTWDEVRYMAEHELFEPAELLRMWSTVTPQAIFPDRQIGEIKSGYEASLLVLGCDPLMDFECALDIQTRMKDGLFVHVPSPDDANPATCRSRPVPLHFGPG